MTPLKPQTQMPTPTMMTLTPAEEHGAVLVGRGEAAGIRAQVEASARGGDTIVVDLTGVETMSPSFADELFAKLEPLVKAGSVQFRNVPSSVRPLARYVIDGRRDDA